MYLIAGQGIAGTTLALCLTERGVPVRVVDNGHRNSSSVVAAGLWNPIVFRRINKSWMADEFIGALQTFYPRMERRLDASFYHPRKILRRHASDQERNYWTEKSAQPEFSAYLEKNERGTNDFPHTAFPFGAGVVSGAGHIDLSEYLHAAQTYFIERGWLEIGDFQDSEIEEKASSLGARGIIDCRGYLSATSPWWSYLPFGLTKGEVLTLRCPELESTRTFNGGFFLLPLGNHLFRLGATFDWKRVDEVPTPEGKQELLEKFEAIIPTPYEIVDHQAGVRPTVKDRRPLMGRHRLMFNRYLFNGLGTKGVMLAPFLAEHFAEFLIENRKLMAEVDLSRFEKHRFS